MPVSLRQQFGSLTHQGRNTLLLFPRCRPVPKMSKYQVDSTQNADETHSSAENHEHMMER